MDQRLLRPVEVALLMGISRSLVYIMLMRGELPSITIHKARRIPAAALDAYIQARLEEEQEKQHTASGPQVPPRPTPTSRSSRRTAR